MVVFSQIKEAAKQNKIPAVVLGFNGTALGIICELGRRGVPVIAIDSSKNLAYFSKYCRPYLSPDIENAPDSYLDFLIRLSRDYSNSVLFPSNDTAVLFIAKNYREIEHYFRITFHNPELVQRIVSKGDFYQLAKSHGILVPNTLIPKNNLDLAGIRGELRFPLIIKPFVSTAFERTTGKKLVKVNSQAELERQFEILREKFPLMVQEIVPGPDEEQFSCAVYMDKYHQPFAVFNARKLRSHPIEFGVGTLVESIQNDSFSSIAINFLADIGYAGIAEVEFKKDMITGQYQMIEINTRSWAQNLLAEKCGVPLSYIAYRDLIGEPLRPIFEYRTGIKWISAERDLFAYSEYKEKGLLNIYRYIKSLRSIRVLDTLAIDDPVPFFYYFLFLRCIGLRTILRKIYSIILKRIPKTNFFRIR